MPKRERRKPAEMTWAALELPKPPATRWLSRGPTGSLGHEDEAICRLNSDRLVHRLFISLVPQIRQLGRLECR